MAYRFDRGKHSVYTLNYHLVQSIKYRRKVLNTDQIIQSLKERTIKIFSIYDCEILAIEPDRDHVHILFKATPTTNLVKLINNWKGATSKYLKNHFPEIRKKLWKEYFWSPSYCIITAGQTTLDQIKQYVESQGE